MDQTIYLITLVGTALVLVAAFSSLIALRFGAPLLLIFLGIGLAVGTDGLGLDFDNAGLAYFAGSLALAVILFDSGFGTALSAFRQAAAPAILLAHEPDYFACADARAFLQISGHTHGGQANLAGWRPMTPSAHGGRYAWGHVREGGRHLIVSGGIGYSGLPLRFMQPPEITLVKLERGS